MSALDGWPEPTRQAIFNALVRGRIQAIVSLVDSVSSCLSKPRNDEEREVAARLVVIRADCVAVEMRLRIRPPENGEP